MKNIIKNKSQNMTLYINTSSAVDIIIGLKNEAGFFLKKKISAPRRQSEKLLVAIDKLLRVNNIDVKNLKKIIVADRGESFTSLRIGILTANALAYAWRLPIIGESFLDDKKTNSKNKLVNIKSFSGQTIVEPIYSREANIGVSKKTNLVSL